MGRESFENPAKIWTGRKHRHKNRRGWLTRTWRELIRRRGNGRPNLFDIDEADARQSPATKALEAGLAEVRGAARNGAPPEALFANVYYLHLAVIDETVDQTTLFRRHLAGLGERLAKASDAILPKPTTLAGAFDDQPQED